MNQKLSSPEWVDESGRKIPTKYITKAQKLREVSASKIVSKALSIQKLLEEFKDVIRKLSEDVLQKQMIAYGAGNREHKGNFTWYNFDRSIRIEVSVNDRIDFDDIAIKAAKEALDNFINESLDEKTLFLKELVTDAFSTSRGKLDSKKVLSLTKYQDKIEHPEFQRALACIRDGIRKPDSKTYYKIYVKNYVTNEYEYIDLNFSSI